MKKHLRMLCMGAVAAFSALSFAQTDVTEKLLNPGAEKGMLGWDVTFVDGGQIWNKQTKGEEKAPGYHGFNNWALENWRGTGTPLTNSSVFQLVKDLPNGTYVFGAYAMATNDSWEPSIDQIQGVYLFANEQEVSVATHRVEGMDEKWAHAIKFNVAVTVTDGTLKVGMKTEECNTNFVAMDNATLWFFGDMSPEAALEEMAKIDIAASVEKIAPFLEAGKMNADTLAYLQAAIEAAKDEVTTENAAQLDEDLYWGKRQAKKSMADYASLAEAIAAAKEVAAGDWTDYDETVAALEALNDQIASAEQDYEEALVTRAEINAHKEALAEAAAVVGLDAVYTLIDVYGERIDSIKDFEGEEIGEYSPEMIENAEDLFNMVNEELAMLGDVSAVEVKANCESLFAKIQEVIDNPLNYYEFPILLHGAEEALPGQSKPWPVLEGAYTINIPGGTDKNGNSYSGRNDVIEYKSQLYRFREPLKSVRFIVRQVGDPAEMDKKGNPHICLGSFAMYDVDGNEIELTPDNTVTNANEPREGNGIPGLLDGNPSTFLHTLWTDGTPEPHYIEVTLPEGVYSAFSFKMTALSNGHSRVFPRELEITYVSPKVTELQQALVAARNLNPTFGTGVGFVNMDPSAYNAALAEGDAVAAKEGVSDSEVQAALNKLNAIIEQIQEAGVMLPEPEKKYRIISGEPRFFSNQNIMKALTVHTDTFYGKWLWWETACVDSTLQEFTLEPLESESDKLYYAIKNVETGLYLSELRDSAGNVVPNGNRFVFTEHRDSFLLKNLGQGQFGILAEGNSREQLNMEFHNNGAWSDVVANYGAIKGVTSYIHTWESNANQSSAWFFREMCTLPQAVRSISELNFRSAAMSIYEGVNILTLTADTDCAFADLVILDVFGNEVAMEELNVEGKVATIKLSKSVESFSFTFTNTEGVAEVTVDGSYKYEGVSAAYTALQNTYNTVLALAPVEGTGVGQVESLVEYNNALAVAEDLLENGGEDAACEAAKAALEAAAAGLVYNLPKADVDYYILLGIDAIRTNHLTDMAVFADENTNALRWTYVSLTNPAYRWRFIDCGELKHGRSAYYIQGVASGCYVARTIESGASVFLVEDTTETRPYDIHFLNNGKVAINDTYWSNGEASLHPNSHGSGAAANKGRNMITWGKHDAASAMRVVEAEAYISEMLLAIGIEDIEIADEYVAPAVKGIYDLFGRRIDTPSATGIYIVDGKKRVIKK